VSLAARLIKTAFSYRDFEVFNGNCNNGGNNEEGSDLLVGWCIIFAD